jgi:hypothetical protein
MELIAAVVIAGPLGYFVRNSRTSLIAYLAIWVVIFPVQSAIVGFVDDFDPLYLVVNAVILVAGVGLNRLGARLRERRTAKRSVVAETA